MRRMFFAAAIAAIAVPGAPALAQYGGSPEQQIDGPAPPMAASPRALPEDQADSNRNFDVDVVRDVDSDVDNDVDSDADVDRDNRDDSYVIPEPGGAGVAAPAPAARADGYVRLRPGDHYAPGGGSAYRPLVPRGPKDPDRAFEPGAPDDQYGIDEGGPDDSADSDGKAEGPSDPGDDEESPPAR